jgi:hypothetical protein
MKKKSLLWLLLPFISLSTQAQTPATAQTAPEPKTSVEWFQRARDQLNLRMPGCKPFHMKVTFHAFPGVELLDRGKKPEILTGDGVYEETWVDPNHWRRQVTLAPYDAVEVESDKGRKMQASSDYEPSRVLMLLNALVYPIPRNFASREFRGEGASGWAIDHLSKGDATLVRVGMSFGRDSVRTNDVFYFLPDGLLVLRNIFGLTTSWENDILFAGKVVPQQLRIKAGDRELLTANVTIEGAGNVDPAIFDLPGSLADPGTTLRPLLSFEVKSNINFAPTWGAEDYASTEGGGPGPHAGISICSVLDRHGRFREVELVEMLVAANKDDAKEIMQLMRESRNPPSKIDGSACELNTIWGWT